jgi:hypothetical protein
MSESTQNHIRREIEEQQARLAELEAERAAAEGRLAELRRDLIESEPPRGRLPVLYAPRPPQSKQEKVALFRVRLSGSQLPDQLHSGVQVRFLNLVRVRSALSRSV